MPRASCFDDLASAAGEVDTQLLAGDAAPGLHWGGIARRCTQAQLGIGRLSAAIAGGGGNNSASSFGYSPFSACCCAAHSMLPMA
jgi:hypothetical protein